jgi:hypothetical protein
MIGKWYNENKKEGIIIKSIIGEADTYALITIDQEGKEICEEKIPINLSSPTAQIMASEKFGRATIFFLKGAISINDTVYKKFH